VVKHAFSTVELPSRKPPTPARHTNGGHLPPAPPPTGGDDRPDGEPERRRPILDNARLATLFLICAETMLFGGLVSGFFVLRLAAPVWPPPLQPRLPVAVTGLNTLVLLASSAAMIAAGRALVANERRAVARWLAVAASLGALFLVVQGYEWARLVGFGLTASSGAYAATFYTLIGAHALHVAGAMTWLAVVLLLARGGRLSRERPAALRACAMYWHFVVGLWPVLYVAVYLL
jgi:heme/copper-type cytochrome/quinol oxidase subunit 3